jgi:hypothetical protein
MRRPFGAVILVLIAAVATTRAMPHFRGRPVPHALQRPAAIPAAPISAATTFDGAKAWEHLRQMVAIGPRPAGSAAIHQARAYMTRALSSYGLTVEEQAFTATTPLGPVEMVNLVVRLPGPRTDRILFTGHYDTKLFSDRVFVGASDGASSAALLIELARALKDRPRAFTYEFVWFDGEEAFDPVRWAGRDHTYGSRYYMQAAQSAKAVASLKANVLVDMIGARNLRVFRETHSTPWLVDTIWGAAKRLGFGQVFADTSAPIEDDHMDFVAAGVPSVDIIDLNDYPQWHTADDNLDHVEAKSLQIVGDVVLAALPEIEGHLIKAA